VIIIPTDPKTKKIRAVMFHEFHIKGLVAVTDSIEDKLNNIGVLSFFSVDNKKRIIDNVLNLKCNLIDNEKGMFSFQRLNDNLIVIKAYLFSQEPVIFPESCSSLSEKYPSISIKYKFYDKASDLCGGIEYINGQCLSQFKFDNEIDVSLALTDYFCAMSMTLDKNRPFDLNGDIILEHMFDERAPGKNPIYVIEVYRIKLYGGDSLCMHIEFNESDPDLPYNLKYLDDSNKVYSLVNASWTKDINEQEEEGLLYEHFNGNISENFMKIVPFEFASKSYIDNN
jgi:hypothetical protein